MRSADMKILLLPITPLLSIVPAKYRLPPMPPPPCSARSPAPAGRTFSCAPILLYCCCQSFLQSIGYRRCPHHRAPHGPPPLQGGLLAVRYRWIEFLVGPFITPLHDWTVPAPYRDSFCPQLLHSFPNHPVDVLRYSGKILHHIQIGIP